jgi:heme oxygenase
MYSARLETSVRSHLHAATAAVHERLDAMVNTLRLDEPATYGRFLAAQGSALFPVEKALTEEGIAALLPDWPNRMRTKALDSDLMYLGVGCEQLPKPQFRHPALLMGAAYVLEGSRLGARVILSRIGNHHNHHSTHFLHHGEGQRLWPTFEAALEATPSVRADLEGAVTGALRTFAMFEQAFAPITEPAH